MDYSVYSRFPNAEPFREIGLGMSKLMKPSHLLDLLSRQPGRRIPFSRQRCAAAFTHSIPDVVIMRTKEEMTDSYTRRVIAAVQNVLSRPLPVLKEPGESMGRKHRAVPSTLANRSVAIGALGAFPCPAFIKTTNVYLDPEPFTQRSP